MHSLHMKPVHPVDKAGRVGPPQPRVIKPPTRTVEETVEFKLPHGSVAGQILHVLVPGHHDLQPVRVPPGAKAGMMLSVQIPAKMALAEGEEEVGAREGESTPESTTEEVEEVAEDVVVVAEVSIKHYIVLIVTVLGTLFLAKHMFLGLLYGYGNRAWALFSHFTHIHTPSRSLFLMPIPQKISCSKAYCVGCGAKLWCCVCVHTAAERCTPPP